MVSWGEKSCDKNSSRIWKKKKKKKIKNADAEVKRYPAA